jgi:hypothetical protein
MVNSDHCHESRPINQDPVSGKVCSALTKDGFRSDAKHPTYEVQTERFETVLKPDKAYDLRCTTRGPSEVPAAHGHWAAGLFCALGD